MEGVLWKWTNYLSGWQPRWFVLESGVLSYYKSQDDVKNGCKGSIKMSACDIKVHPTDATRLDLTIPGEQYYYVRAAQPQDRQSWLIALGSAKAMYGQPKSQTQESAGELTSDLMRSKKSELRLYCDLLMQQVHSVKESITKQNGQAQVPDIEKLNEATSLLSATCDTFIQTLDEVMKLLHESAHGGDPVLPSSPKRSSVPTLALPVSRSNSSEKPSKSRKSSASSLEGPSLIHVKAHRRSRMGSDGSHSDASVSENANNTSSLIVSETTIRDLKFSVGDNFKVTGVGVQNCTESDELEKKNELKSEVRNEDGDGLDEFKDAIDTRLPTFFSAMSVSFVSVQLLEDDGVPVEPFLDACREIVPIFDKLNSTAFAPVKLDFSGNIKKIHQKQISSIAAGHSGFPSLQAMVLSEVKAKQSTNSNSATVALCWLKRGLEFIREFLREICSGGPELSECASNAYSRTLKKYHNWVVRGVFAVAVKALPYREEFLGNLATVECQPRNVDFLDSLMSDMELFLKHLNHIILIINNFYTIHQLDNQEQI